MAGPACSGRSHHGKTDSRHYDGPGHGSGGTGPHLLQTLEPAWENAIRDWLIPLNLDTNHGYAKEPVVNSELAKRQGVLEGREQRLEHLAQISRARLADLRDQDHQLEAQAQTYEQQWMELSIQVILFEAA